MKITQVYRTRNGVVGPTSINGYGVIKVNGLRYDKDENKYYDSEDNEVILEEGREYYSNNKLYVYDGKLTELLTDLMIEVKYTELVELRNNGELIPGVKYRIIDYQCTTAQENTKSAGHQFDIVLLALSNNKLAEEGWAMMHDNIYDVTFADGVTKKCYLYEDLMDVGFYYVVDVDTLLGISSTLEVLGGDIQINEENKIATTNAYDSGDLTETNVPYNYFQNSKLEAWKVWYCLDNDKSRFAWVDDIVDEGTPASITINALISGVSVNAVCTRDTSRDKGGKYCWWGTFPPTGNSGFPIDVTIYTDEENPTTSSKVYRNTFSTVFEETSQSITAVTPAQEGTGPNGRGVIYRLIDEWNNDCPYDFKNIQYKRKVDSVNLPTTNIEVNESFFYTFSIVNENGYEILDASIFAKKFVNDEQGEGRCYSNFISSVDEYDMGISTNNIYTLPDIVFARIVMNYDSCCIFVNIKCYNSKSLSILGDLMNVNFIGVLNVNSETTNEELTNVTLYNISNRTIDNFALKNNIIVVGLLGLKKINLVDL